MPGIKNEKMNSCSRTKTTLIILVQRKMGKNNVWESFNFFKKLGQTHGNEFFGEKQKD